MISSVGILAVHLSGNINLGELIVGVGTLALAVITWRLARATGASVAEAKVSAKAAKEGVEAARDSAAAERASVEAMAMPYVIAVPREVGAEIQFAPRPSQKGVGTLELCLWNLGSGPSIITSVGLSRQGEPLLSELPRWIPLAAGNQFPGVNIDVGSWPTAPENEPVAATLKIEYLHSNGRPYRTDSDVKIEGSVLTCLTFRRSPAEEPSRA
jgi:hypothetical protein